MTQLEAGIKTTWQQERKLGASIAQRRLLAMLQSTLRSYPKARLMTRKAGFGALLDENTCLYVSFRGDLTPEVKSDLLALFVVWLRADPEALNRPNTLQDG